MTRLAGLIFIALLSIPPAVAVAGPAEDANVAVDRWSAAYSGNDPETIAKNYCPDAILLGTVSPIMSEGTQAIITYFTPTKGTGNKNTIDERRTIVIDDLCCHGPFIMNDPSQIQAAITRYQAGAMGHLQPRPAS